jgi:putative FmdB family regulatory protein
MPTYDYVCDNCAHKWDLFQSIMADPDKKCPACGKKKARRVIGPGAGIIFKGSGFYQTDYRSNAYQKAAAADQKSESSSSKAAESSSSSDSKSDSKPAAKSESKPAKSKSAD